jgi:hypothetical protein
MKRVDIMIARIVEQIGVLTRVKSTGTVRASARRVEFSAIQDKTLEQQVAQVAGVVTELVLNDLGTMNGFNPKENYANAN